MVMAPSFSSMKYNAGEGTPARWRRWRRRASTTRRCLVRDLSRAGWRYGFGGRIFTADGVEGRMK